MGSPSRRGGRKDLKSKLNSPPKPQRDRAHPCRRSIAKPDFRASTSTRGRPKRAGVASSDRRACTDRGRPCRSSPFRRTKEPERPERQEQHKRQEEDISKEVLRAGGKTQEEGKRGRRTRTRTTTAKPRRRTPSWQHKNRSRPDRSAFRPPQPLCGLPPPGRPSPKPPTRNAMKRGKASRGRARLARTEEVE